MELGSKAENREGLGEVGVRVGREKNCHQLKS